MEIVIERYSIRHESSHKDFVLATYGKRRKRINPDYIKWKFGENDKMESPNFVLAIDKSNDEVVGQIGYIPCKLKIGDQVVLSQWAGNLMIRPEYRGKGIGTMLYNYGVERLFTIGSNPSPSANRSMVKAGFSICESGSLYFFPSKLKTIFQKKNISLGKLIDNLSWPFKLIKPKAEYDLAEITMNKFIAIYDQIITNDNQIRVIHDEEFWNWRGKPFKDYHFQSFFYGDNGACCFVIRYMNESIIVEDLVAVDKKVYKKCIRFIISLLKKKNLSEILLLENNPDFNLALRMSGFLKYATPTSIIYSDSGCQEGIKKAFVNQKFRYTLCDSDENL